MRIKLASLAVIFTAAITLSSCLNSDDETEYNFARGTGISTFTLGTMNRYLHTTSAAGADSVYRVQFSGSGYKMTIDQAGGRIFNTDSLPYGTDTKHVIATINAVDNGTILLKDFASDTLRYYNSSDSIDFSQPRTVRIISQDGQRYADYVVTLNTRKVPANTMAWMRKAENSEIAALDDIHMYAAGDYVYVFGRENGSVVGFSSPVSDGVSWTRLPGISSGNTSIVTKNGYLYELVNGNVFQSTDNGQNFIQTGSNNRLLKLVAASTKHLYALTTTDGTNPDGLASSADNGASWTQESLDGDSALLPSSQVGYTCIPVRTNDSIDQVMITGYVANVNDVVARTWTKLDDYSSHPLKTEWTNVDFNWNYRLEGWGSLSIATYGGAAVALGNSGSSVSSLLRSRDGGLTWHDSELSLPDGLTPTVGKLAMTVDSEGSMWIISGGTVWKN